MNEDNATRAELLEVLAKQAVRLTRVENERDMWRNENVKKTAACEQMGNRICTLEIERDRMKGALRDLHASATHAYKYRPTDTPSGFKNAMRELAETMERARAALMESGE
jgi:hypothetical protein